MAGGSNGGNLGNMLPLMLAVGATVATGGAAAPALIGGETLGLGAGTLGAGMMNAGLIGAGSGALSGIMQGQSGGDILKNSLMGGALGAGTAGILGGLGGAAGATPGAVTAGGEAGVGALEQNTSNLINQYADQGLILNQEDAAKLALQNQIANSSLDSGIQQSYTSALNNGSAPEGIARSMGAAQTAQVEPSSLLDKAYNPTGIRQFAPLAASTMLGGNMFAQPTLGAVAGTQKYSGPLSKFHYDPSNYSPDVVTPPNPLYSASYPNYRANPYGAAQGGIVGMADGGTVEQMSRENSLGGNQMFPQSGIGGLTGANTYQNATNTPMANNVLEPTDAITDPYTGQMKFAPGGIAKVPSAVGINNPMDKVDQYITAIKADQTGQTLQQVMALAQKDDANALAAISKLQQEAQMQQAQQAQAQMQQTQAPVQAAQGGIMGYAGGGNMRGTIGSYSDGGQMLKGPGDGMSDSIPAKIGKHQPARLADSEFVVPADVVSHLGNGSTDAGAKQLYAMMDRVRTARTGRKTQGKQIKPEKYMPA